MPAPKRIVAFAYENPVFDEPGTESKTSGKKEDSKLEVGHDPNERPDAGYDPEELIYPDYKALFWRLKWQYFAFQLLILADILIEAYTDPLDNSSLTIQILVTCTQIGIILAIMVAFFVFTSQTIFIRLGRYDTYFSEFKFFFLTFLVEFLFIIAAKVYFIVMFYQNTPAFAMWEDPAFKGLWIAQRIVLLAFWITATYSASQVFRSKNYDPDYLLNTCK